MLVNVNDPPTGVLTGVTCTEDDGTLVPAIFVAVTEQEYVTPFVNPVTRIGLAAARAVIVVAPATQVAVYWVTKAPPFDAGEEIPGTRRAQRVVAKVGEQGFGRVARGFIDGMAVCAIALLADREKAQAALFLLGKLCLSAHDVVELRGEGLKHARALKRGNGRGDGVKRGIGLIENLCAP